MKITAPSEGFTGKTNIGPHVLEFEDGVAKVDELPDGLRAYLVSAGYGLGAKNPTTPEDVDVADPREVGSEQFGTRLRDAAVDPSDDDFLPPTNAGQANPHGPDVVAPGIHANEGVRPVKPGDVHVDDVDEQEQAETEHAEAATDGTPVDDGPEPPAGNASRADWQEYARQRGDDPGDLTRDQLRDKYTA